MSKALEVYNLICSMPVDEAKNALQQASEYYGVVLYPSMDCGRVNRIKLIKMIMRADSRMDLRKAKGVLDAFIEEVQADAKAGETASQKQSRRADALEIYKHMLDAGLSYELAVNATKNALTAFNKEF